jgi:hypothetical protein
VIVRDAQETDYSRIAEIHRQSGMDYKLPDLANPLFFVRKVIQDGDNFAACFLRLTSETFLWVPPTMQPRKKLELMENLQPEVLKAAWERGIDETEAHIPEWMERRFQKRLKQLGWSKDREDWHSWSIATHP